MSSLNELNFVSAIFGLPLRNFSSFRRSNFNFCHDLKWRLDGLLEFAVAGVVYVVCLIGALQERIGEAIDITGYHSKRDKAFQRLCGFVTCLILLINSECVVDVADDEIVYLVPLQNGHGF
ncbi:hypothetical protein CXB49_07065 [Chromobacterium sp. ATCC 53434]|nr:hypothetical protein CXB49_07065 [Chromobacterium sp. ATCC 53434]